MIEEKVGNSIQGFVSEKGWEKFREVEREIVADISLRDNMIISTGGGVVTVPENVENLRRNGWLIWLHAVPETIMDRMKRDDCAEDGTAFFDRQGGSWMRSKKSCRREADGMPYPPIIV